MAMDRDALVAAVKQICAVDSDELAWELLSSNDWDLGRAVQVMVGEPEAQRAPDNALTSSLSGRPATQAGAVREMAQAGPTDSDVHLRVTHSESQHTVTVPRLTTLQELKTMLARQY